MGTNIRPVIKSDKVYHISKHRYYELKHFCLQYPEWKMRYQEGIRVRGSIILGDKKLGSTSDQDPVGEEGVRKASLSTCMKMVEDTARRTDKELGEYIFKAVTEDLSFVRLKSKYSIPCERKMYYDRYRKFFWLLDKVR